MDRPITSYRFALMATAGVLACVLVIWLAFWPPASFEDGIAIRWCQWTTDVSSSVLDFLGVSHLPEDMVIGLPRQQLDLKRAVAGFCSPPFILFVAIILFARRQPTLSRVAMVVALSLLWVLWAQVTGVVVMVVVSQWWQFDLSSGWPNYFLGMAIFAVTILLIGSSDQIVRYLCGPISPAWSPTPHVVWWNRRVAGNSLGHDEIEDVPFWPAIWQFAEQWFWTRESHRILLGTPAFLVGFAAFLTIGLATSVSGPRLSRRYATEAREALSHEDIEAAEMLYRRATQEDSTNLAARLGCAAVAERRGDLEKARLIMQDLAPWQKGGSPDAHLWLAHDLANRQQALTARESEELWHHIQHLVRQRPESIEGRSLLADWHLARGQFGAAIEQLLVVGDRQPELRLRLAHALLKQGRESAARLHLLAVSDHFRRLAEADFNKVQERIWWAEAELMLENYDSAISIVEEGLNHRDDERYQQMLASFDILKADEFLRFATPERKEALQYLRRALKRTPKNPEVLRRLSLLAKAVRPLRGEIRELLLELVESGNDSAEARLLLGNIAFDDGDFETAVSHYEFGYLVNPDLVELNNNLAWSLGQIEPPQLQRALRLAEKTVQQGSPDPSIMAEFRITWGLLLTKANRWREAISELEYALLVFPDRADVRLALAGVYEKIGESDIGEKHRQLAQESNSVPAGRSDE